MFRILWWIVVGLVAGWATGKIMRGGGYGTAMDIVIGIAGALAGGWIMHLMGFSREGGLIYTILVAIGGANALGPACAAAGEGPVVGLRAEARRPAERRY